jgi:hypothetical protein
MNMSEQYYFNTVSVPAITGHIKMIHLISFLLPIKTKKEHYFIWHLTLKNDIE